MPDLDGVVRIFTFQYVSIKTLLNISGCHRKVIFTFQYVSIKTVILKKYSF